MIIAGLQKTTLIDYPGKLACTVFLAVCNFRCPWCYSSELVLPEKIIKQPRIFEKEFFDFLRSRQGRLEGVVVCGGEPTVNKELPEFIRKIKNLGYFVKLDTNGSNPEMLKDLITQNLIDYVAMDIKGPMGRNFQFPISNFQSNPNDKIEKNAYRLSLGESVTLDEINKSVEILKRGDVDFEFRTTCVPGVHKKEDFLEIAKWIGGPDVKYYLQNFRPEKTIDPNFEQTKPFSKEFLEQIAKGISPHFNLCQVR